MSRVLLLLLYLLACQKKLVDESYATLGRKSINGIDRFTDLLKENGELSVTPYLNDSARYEADLIVHFDPGPSLFQPPEYESIEKLLEEGFLYSAPPAEEIEETEEIQIEEVLHGRSALISQTPDEEDADEDEEADDEPLRKTPFTLLFFLRDTDHSAHFWAARVADMEGHDGERAFALDLWKERLSALTSAPQEEEVLLGMRRLAFPSGQRFTHGWSYLFRNLPAYIPVRYFALEPQSSGFSSWRPLLASPSGHHLIREFLYDGGRLLLVYNADLFLNYAMMPAQNDLFARELIELSLADSPGRKIALITDSMLPLARAMESEKNDSLWKILRSFPLNLILLFGLLPGILYLWSRWPHTGRPVALEERSNRDFLEHIEALGVKMDHSDHLESAARLLLNSRVRPYSDLELKISLEKIIKEKE